MQCTETFLYKHTGNKNIELEDILTSKMFLSFQKIFYESH